MPLAPLRAPGPEAERERLHRAAQALEALILKQLVTASKAFTGGEGAGSAVRAGMFADALADAMVKGGGIGLAEQIERSLSPGASPSPHPALFPTLSPPREAREEDSSTSTLSGGQAPALRNVLVTSPYGLRQDPFDGHLTRHEGVDLAGEEGAEIRAAAGGVVRRAGALGGYGNAVEVDHGNGITTLYAHASDLLVREGERVRQGQPIARVGHTGRATGTHLHFEVRQGGRPVDPSRALKIYGLRADTMIGSGS
jgi:murein DD-endopeptidase MepM/ murein hydrolase activator NlpD